jgi:hypothetical protein
MGSHFLKSTTAAKATGVFCYYEELFQLYIFNPWHEFKSCERVICPSANLTHSSDLIFCIYLLPSCWKTERDS